MTLDPHAQRLLRMLAGAAGATTVETDRLQARRGALRQLAALGNDPPDTTVIAKDLFFQSSGAIPLRCYRAGDAALRPGLMVYLHGGGWVCGDLETHDGVCRALCRSSGCDVLAVDYRRPPEHPFPAALDDAVAAVAWAQANAARLGADDRRIVLVGDSAGANIAAAAAGLLAAAAKSPLALLVLICPILQIEPQQPSRQDFARGYFIDPTQMAQDLADYLPRPDDRLSPLASPLQAPSLKGLPQTHLHLAEYDPFRDEGLAYATRLEQAGMAVKTWVHPGMIHYFYALPRLIPYARIALNEIGVAARAAIG